MSIKSNQVNAAERIWESGWDDHERQQLRRLAKLSLEEKLAWLEEAHRLVQNSRKTRDQADSPIRHQTPTGDNR